MHDNSNKTSPEISLNGFFGLVFIPEVIKLTYLLYEKMTSLSNPWGSKPGEPIFWPNVLSDRALKLLIGMASDSKFCLILPYKS